MIFKLVKASENLSYIRDELRIIVKGCTDIEELYDNIVDLVSDYNNIDYMINVYQTKEERMYFFSSKINRLSIDMNPSNSIVYDTNDKKFVWMLESLNSSIEKLDNNEAKTTVKVLIDYIYNVSFNSKSGNSAISYLLKDKINSEVLEEIVNRWEEDKNLIYSLNPNKFSRFATIRY